MWSTTGTMSTGITVIVGSVGSVPTIVPPPNQIVGSPIVDACVLSVLAWRFVKLERNTLSERKTKFFEPAKWIVSLRLSPAGAALKRDEDSCWAKLLIDAI